jgi:hypothetical protein
MTPEDYNEKAAKQDYRCAICKKSQSEFLRRLAVNHNHETGQNRDLLCENCNPGLGQFQDSPELLRAAADYLETYANVPNSN